MTGRTHHETIAQIEFVQVDLDPEAIPRRLGVQPTKSWRAGDPPLLVWSRPLTRNPGPSTRR
jgi:hypothetical protein